MLKKLPHMCPSCASPLRVKSLICGHCATEVSGEFELPILASIPLDDQQFILDFVKSSGSLKLMAESLKLSYPTVRNMLDDIIKRVEKSEKLSNSNKK
ncbi:MAG TPA: DUF2089 family protein [Bacteroidia bacterium]|nr:DUF2089 family protein [Bacteroidia bacterium]